MIRTVILSGKGIYHVCSARALPPKGLLISLVNVDLAKYLESKCEVVSVRFLLGIISHVRCMLSKSKGRCMMPVVDVATVDVNLHTSIRLPG